MRKNKKPPKNYSKDCRLLVDLHNLVKNRSIKSERASSLLKWHLRHHFWTEPQRRLAQLLCEEDSREKAKKTSTKKSKPSARNRDAAYINACREQRAQTGFQGLPI